jgi:outer membrane protein TolC
MRARAIILTLCAGVGAHDVAVAEQPSPGIGAPRAETAGPPRAPALDRVALEAREPLASRAVPPARVLGSLGEALERARRGASRVVIGRARIAEANGEARRRLADFLPRLDAAASGLHTRASDGLQPGVVGLATGSAPGTSWGVGAGLRVPLLATRAWYDYGTARRATTKAHLDAQALEREQSAEVADKLVDVIVAERLAAVSRRALGASLVVLDLNRQGTRAGLSNEIDVLRAEEELAASRVQLLQTENTLLETREELAGALGETSSVGAAPQLTFAELEREAAALCRPLRSLSSRPDVVSATIGAELAAREAASVARSFVPSVDAISSLSYGVSAPGDLDAPGHGWFAGAVASWSIYDGGAREGASAAGEARAVAADEQRRETWRAALRERERIARLLRIGLADVALVRESHATVSRKSELTRIAYENGAGTAFDMVEAARRLRESEVEVVIKESTLTRARLAAAIRLGSCAAR